MTTKQVAKVEEAKLPAAITDDAFDLLFGASGIGMQHVRAEDLAIPFMAVIQSNSPQRKKQDGAYIQGADEGMVFNTVTGELFDVTPGNGLLYVLLCGFKKKLLHWRDREQGGGMLGQYDIDDPITQDAERKGGRMVLPDGTYLVETAEHYCLLVYADGTVKRVVVAMSSTQLKKSRRWMTMVSEKQLRHPGTGRYFTPPPFAYKYALSTQAESNDQGDWHGWKVADAGALDLTTDEGRALFELAQAFAKSVDKGDVKTSERRGDDHAADAPGATARPRHEVDDDSIPF
jgi:hypothetical protein